MQMLDFVLIIQIYGEPGQNGHGLGLFAQDTQINTFYLGDFEF